MADCGTPAGYRHHQKNGEATCDDCRAAWRTYSRDWRLRNLEKARATQRDWRLRNLDKARATNRVANRKRYYAAPAAAAERQRVYREANPTYSRDWYRARTARNRRLALRGTATELLLDYVETHPGHDSANLYALVQQRHPDIPATTLQKALYRLLDLGEVRQTAAPPCDDGLNITDRKLWWPAGG